MKGAFIMSAIVWLLVAAWMLMGCAAPGKVELCTSYSDIRDDVGVKVCREWEVGYE